MFHFLMGRVCPGPPLTQKTVGVWRIRKRHPTGQDMPGHTARWAVPWPVPSLLGVNPWVRCQLYSPSIHSIWDSEGCCDNACFPLCTFCSHGLLLPFHCEVTMVFYVFPTSFSQKRMSPELKFMLKIEAEWTETRITPWEFHFHEFTSTIPKWFSYR